MLNSLPVRLLWRSFNWLTRLAIVISSVVVVLIALAIIVMRYWILPDIGQYQDRITASVANAIGSPVTVGKIEGDWLGFRPYLKLTDVRILDEQRQPALILPSVDGSLSWMSLFTAELRLSSLEIDRPELLIRRDMRGGFFIGGVAVSGHGGGGGLSDWLLHQSSMVVRDALIVWVDEQRNAPPLVLQQVNFRAESFFGHHSFALRAIPPEDLSTPLDVRGDFRGGSFDDLGEWRGQIFAQLDYTDVTAWRPWLDLPGAFSRGRGALRGWLDIEAGRVAGVTADVVLHDVATRLAEDVPEMNVIVLRGRAAWQEVSDGVEISTRHLSMRLQDGLELQPTDFYFLARRASDQQPAGGVIRANLLQLDILAGMARYLPLNSELRTRLDEYAPRGKLSNLDAEWQGPPEKPDHFKLKGHFENLAVNQVGRMPGFSGLTVDVNGSEESGRLSINSRGLKAQAPGELREPLFFDTLTGQAGWKREDGELFINADNIAVSNEDLAGNLYGSYRTKSGTLGVLDLTGGLTRGDIRRAARYTPLFALDKQQGDWLNGALLAGHTEDFHIRIKGNLGDFPQDGTKDLLFNIGGHARDAVLEFSGDWPRIENISGEFSIQGNRLEVKSPSATILGAHLQNVAVVLPDMMSRDLSLEIKGEADAPSNMFLQFIQNSPVRGYIDGFTDGMRASGRAHLDLSLHIPLSAGPEETVAESGAGAADVVQGSHGRNPLKISGIISVQDNDIDLGRGVPLLRKTRGSLSFTESGMQASNIRTEVLGGTASIDLRSGAGGMTHASVQGRSNLDILRKSERLPLLNYLRGSAAWNADINVIHKSTQLIFNSDLRGISSSLPQPFAKRANAVMPLQVEKSQVAEGQDVIAARLGDLLTARLARVDENGTMSIKRGTIKFGNTGKSPNRDGVWLAGTLPELSIQGWEGLAGDAGDSSPVLPVAGADLHIAKLTGYGQDFKEVRVRAVKHGKKLSARLSGSMLNGEVVWQPHFASSGSGQGYEKNGKLSVHLRSLDWKKQEQSAALPKPKKSSLPDETENTVQSRPGNLPAMEFAIENLQYKDKQIGRFELVGYPDGQDWRMRRLRVTNPDGALMGDGIWHGNGQSQVNLILDISDAGNILGRSGYPNTVKAGSGRLVANLSWAGMPDEFNYATLNGSLKLDTGKGQFLKMEPGAGKLLSILSLQALPQHISLGFTDVFSSGFQFDKINGNALIKNGVLETQDLLIDGASAKVTMLGSVDLNNETQNLRVRIMPRIGNSISGISCLINPVACIALFAINKGLGEPLDKLVSFEYNVSGTWADPSVVKIGKVPARTIESNP